MKKQDIIAWTLVALNTSALFYASSQSVEKSRQSSDKVTQLIVRTVEEVYPEIREEINYRDLHRNVRKSSHYVLYMMLGYLMANAFRKRGEEKLAYSLLICMLISIIDETYQLQIVGRGGELNDVVIDTIGSATGIGLNKVVCNVKQKLPNNQLTIKQKML